MTRRWLAFYLANWYAFALAGVLMSLQHPAGHWLRDLPWASWGTELGEALAGQGPVSGGALWILMGATLCALGVLASIVVSLGWLADQEAARGQRPAAAAAPGGQSPATEPSLSPKAREAAGLVEDPRLRSLIQQLDTRLG